MRSRIFNSCVVTDIESGNTCDMVDTDTCLKHLLMSIIEENKYAILEHASVPENIPIIAGRIDELEDYISKAKTYIKYAKRMVENYRGFIMEIQALYCEFLRSPASDKTCSSTTMETHSGTLVPSPVKKNINVAGIRIDVDEIDDPKKIPEVFYYYRGDKSNPEGVYTKIFNTVMKVPFPNIINGVQDHNREKTLRCKYIHKEKCLQKRQNLAKTFGGPIRECKFAHSGDTFNKVGLHYRCPEIPDFGNHKNLTRDIHLVDDDSLDRLAFNAVSDMFLLYITYKYNKIPLQFKNKLDIC